MKLQSNMRVIKLKEHWNSNNNFLVNEITGKITLDGLDTYWKAIDSGIQFNIAKRNEFLKSRFKAKKADKVTPHVAKPYMHRDGMGDFFKRRRSKDSYRTEDRFHWCKDAQRQEILLRPGNRFLLPKLHN